MAPYKVFAVCVDDHPRVTLGFIVARGDYEPAMIEGTVLYFRNRGDAVRKRDELNAAEGRK